MKNNLLLQPNILIIILMIIIMITGVSSCIKDDGIDQNPQNQFAWKKIGLNGLKVNKLVLFDNYLYAATEDGIYIKNVDVDGSFEAIGLQEKNIKTLVIFEPEEIIASVYDFKDGEQIDIYRTTNEGQVWEIMETNFGNGDEPQVVYEFLRPFDSGNTLYATSNHLLAKSEDKGVSWTPIWGDWGQFAKETSVAINPVLPNEIWLGGQGGIEDGYLVRLENGVEKDRWLDLVPNPTTVKKIAFDAQNPQSVYVGFEGALMKSTNNGQSWETVIDEHEISKFFYGIVISSSNFNNKIFAGGWLKGNEPQPLILYYSTDKGISWKKDVFASEQYGGVLDMVSKVEGTKERLFLALDKGGVYEVVVRE